MDCDWILFTTHFAIPLVVAGVLSQVIIQVVGGWISGG